MRDRRGALTQVATPQGFDFGCHARNNSAKRPLTVKFDVSGGGLAELRGFRWRPFLRRDRA